MTTKGLAVAIRRLGAAAPMGTRSGWRWRSECRCRRVMAAAGCAAMVAESICEFGWGLVMGWECEGAREGGRAAAVAAAAAAE